MMTKKFHIVILVHLLISYGLAAQSELQIQKLNVLDLRPAILYWDYGSPEYITIETIYPSNDSLNSYWNVSHRSLFTDDSTGNGFDYCKVNTDGLRPYISHMYHPGNINYHISFDGDSASLSIKTKSNTINYKIKIPESVAPEGPGTPVFIAGLPLKVGYHDQYYELNRWSGKAPQIGQIELTDLKVVGLDSVQIDGKMYQTYRLTITNDNGRLTEIWVLKNKPHYWVKVNHKVVGQEEIRSKVVKLFIFNN